MPSITKAEHDSLNAQIRVLTTSLDESTLQRRVLESQQGKFNDVLESIRLAAKGLPLHTHPQQAQVGGYAINTQTGGPWAGSQFGEFPRSPDAAEPDITTQLLTALATANTHIAGLEARCAAAAAIAEFARTV